MTRIRSGAATDVGRVRRNNQDNYVDDEPLFAVADGMGGAAGGEEASRTAVTALRATFEADPSVDGLADGVREANRAVWEKARQRPDLRGMGTTMTAVALVEHDEEGEVLAIVNVGDSRVYLLRDGELEQITDDHSVPEELRRAGRLTPEEAAVHPQRNVLTRALGIEPDVEVDCYPIIPYEGDRLILASDGLFNEVDHDGIASVARRRKDPQEAADELVRLACEGGGNDNVTVVVVDIVDDGDRSERASAAVASTARSASATSSGAGGASAGAAGGPAIPHGTRAPSGAPSVTGFSPAVGTGAPPAAAPPAQGGGYGGGPQPVTAREGRPRLTLRVVVFLVAVMVVAAAMVGAVGFFARGGYYVGLENDRIAIFKGRPGGLLWFEPTVEERTEVGLGDVLPSRAADLRDGKEYSSLADARRYVQNLEDEATPTTTTTTTTTLPPPTTAPPPAAAPAASVP